MAYQSLLKSTRQHYHQRIADALERGFPDKAETEPEMIAHHFAEAGLAEKAIAYFHEAGKRAAERSANAEAVSHLTRALELLEGRPESPEREREELALLIQLGTALISSKGPRAPEVERTYLRARELCGELADDSQLFTVLWGLWYVNQSRGALDAARELADEVLAIAERDADTGQLLEAHHALWTTNFELSDLLEARQHLERGRTLYSFDAHHNQVFLYGGHDSGVCCRSIGPLVLWLLGVADQARTWIEEGLALADQLSHPTTLAHCHYFAAYLHQFLGDREAVRAEAEATVAVADEYGIGAFSKMGAILRGWALSEGGEPALGLAEMERILAGPRRKARSVVSPYLLALLAQVYSAAGRTDDGLVTLSEALETAAGGGGRYWTAELHRLKGQLILSATQGSAEEAVTCFGDAIDVARAQSARALELRAATSLARLYRAQGKVAEARDPLAPVYDWFTEGFDTPDLMDAKALLDELS